MSHWLRSPSVLKVTQACASDAGLLAKHGIVMAPVFDTTMADIVLRGDLQQRNLKNLLDEFVEPRAVLP